LIRDGAVVIASVEDAMALMGLTIPVRSRPTLETQAEERVWAELKLGSATLDTLCARSRLPVNECLAAVTALELRGAIECALTGEIRKR
jgi:predicted Rossmann fold nucleotide-binding protein DprA/Smf involved in DNA uptake